MKLRGCAVSAQPNGCAVSALRLSASALRGDVHRKAQYRATQRNRRRLSRTVAKFVPPGVL